jgi:hypothetical protein
MSLSEGGRVTGSSLGFFDDRDVTATAVFSLHVLLEIVDRVVETLHRQNRPSQRA